VSVQSPPSSPAKSSFVQVLAFDEGDASHEKEGEEDIRQKEIEETAALPPGWFANWCVSEKTFRYYNSLDVILEEGEMAEDSSARRPSKTLRQRDDRGRERASASPPGLLPKQAHLPKRSPSGLLPEQAHLPKARPPGLLPNMSNVVNASTTSGLRPENSGAPPVAPSNAPGDAMPGAHALLGMDLLQHSREVRASQVGETIVSSGLAHSGYSDTGSGGRGRENRVETSADGKARGGHDEDGDASSHWSLSLPSTHDDSVEGEMWQGKIFSF